MENIKYKKLFEPLDVNSVTLKNRIIASPIDAHHSREKTIGGASLIVLGGGFVAKETRGMIAPRNENPFEIHVRDKALAMQEEVHFYRQGGSKVSIELLHAGLYGLFRGTDFVYGPSAGTRPEGTEIVEVDEERMQLIIDEFSSSAAVARKMGYDMVTAHFAHGWLISEFLSPTWNKRTDQYGGSYENRIRFPKMVLQAVRKAVGKDFPIDMRINAKDWVGEGMPLEEVAQFLEDMASEGLVDMANISCGTDMNLKGNIHMTSHPIHPRMVNIEFSKYIKERVSIPITVVGAIETPEEAEHIIANGYADAVWLGRALVADPFWPQKAYEDRADEITPCLRCLYCFPMATRAQNFGCAVNPRMNKEDAYPLNTKAKKSKKVVIVGGGASGMKAGITAADRGHDVVILEKSEQLGGVIRFTDYVASKQDLHRYMNYLITMVGKAKIDVRLEFDATPENVKALGPDVIMVAVGAESFIPPIPGIDKAIVTEALDVFPKMKEMKKKVVVIGGGTAGCELAIDLAEYDKEVTIVEMTDTLNSAANNLYKLALAEKMEEFQSITTMTKTKCLEIKEDCVMVQTAEGETIQLDADEVVVATGYKPKKSLAKTFFGITPETYTLGDCNKVGIIKNTTEDAYFFTTNILD